MGLTSLTEKLFSKPRGRLEHWALVDRVSALIRSAADTGTAFSSAASELGRALGGYINVVTKSGTNLLRGTVYDYLRDDALNAKNALSGTKLPMDKSQYGGSVGGPSGWPVRCANPVSASASEPNARRRA